MDLLSGAEILCPLSVSEIESVLWTFFFKENK